MCDPAVNLLDAGFCRGPYFLLIWPAAPSGIRGPVRWSSSREGHIELGALHALFLADSLLGMKGYGSSLLTSFFPLSISPFRRSDLSDLCVHLSDLP